MTTPAVASSPPARGLPASEFVRRVERLRAWQRGERLDALLLADRVNRYYFTGLWTSNGVLLSQPGVAPIFYTDFRYLSDARRHLTHMRVEELWQPSQTTAVFAGLSGRWQRVGFEGTLPAARFLKWQSALPKCEWVNISTGVSSLRAIKSSLEICRLRAAIAANDEALARTLARVRVGMSEWRIREIARQEVFTRGQDLAFEPIICVGRNAADCHHQPGEARLRNGQPLLVDMGLKLDHYCSDITRTVVVNGEPAPLLRKLHGIVLAANRAAIRGIRPGRECAAIDALARRVIERAGYGRYFGHGLGHALGLEVHESPSFSPSCDTRLVPGMVLTVEPGIYLPGRLGVRIEDVVLITDSGCEVLTQASRELLRPTQIP